MKRFGGVLLLFFCVPAGAGEGPDIESQPVPCTLPEKPYSICARVTTDTQITAARVYFRREGADFFNFVDMTFGGINYCATLPSPRAKSKAVEYYVEAIDQNFEPRRLSTYRINVTEVNCEFAPIEKDATKAGAITVHATNRKQGRKLDEAFDSAGVTFIPVAQPK
jgi:hypothetical protein